MAESAKNGMELALFQRDISSHNPSRIALKGEL